MGDEAEQVHSQGPPCRIHPVARYRFLFPPKDVLQGYFLESYFICGTLIACMWRDPAWPLIHEDGSILIFLTR